LKPLKPQALKVLSRWFAALAFAIACVMPVSPVTAQVVVDPAPPVPTPLTPVDALADEIRQHLLEAFLPRVFPAVIDPAGGYHQNFDRAWQPSGDVMRTLVYQTRLLWTTSEIALRYPELREAYLDYAQHGADYIINTMTDPEHGGMFWVVGIDGQPAETLGLAKDIYGQAFSIYALAHHYRASDDERSLETAKTLFAWIEKVAHDDEHGGYFEMLNRDGSAVMTPLGDYERGRLKHAMPTPYGFKSMNSHIHLMEAFTELYRCWPDEHLGNRLEEVYGLVLEKVYVEPGVLAMFLTRDWRIVPTYHSYGHDVETAFLLMETAEVLGKLDDPRLHEVARALIDQSLKRGFDAERGGLGEHGEAFAPAADMRKRWWSQAELLNALAMSCVMHPQEPRYREAMSLQWRWITEHQVDAEHSGWFDFVEADGTPIFTNKLSPWKATYHEVRALTHAPIFLDALRNNHDLRHALENIGH
jgi:mannobiose 2-epimerase